MTLPGLVIEPVSAIVGIAVRPSHRRRGRLRSMMRFQLDDFRERGEHTAVLTSSEARIYERFGYGAATLTSFYEADKRGLELVLDPPASSILRLVELEAAERSFPEVFSKAQRLRAGEVSRPAPLWKEALGHSSDPALRDRFFVEHREAGTLTGYAVYRIVEPDPTDSRRRRVNVREICATTPAAYLSLWSFLIGLDLVDELRTAHRPVDEPIRWALTDYRRLQVSWSREYTLVRLVDVARSLAARRYHEQGSLNISLSDPFCPWNEGVYRLEVHGGSGEADVERRPAEEPSQLSMDAAVLASMYMGGLTPSALAKVGLLSADGDESLALADRMFVGPVPPFCSSAF
jgi:predicted acetyltransferase